MMNILHKYIHKNKPFDFPTAYKNCKITRFHHVDIASLTIFLPITIITPKKPPDKHPIISAISLDFFSGLIGVIGISTSWI